MNNIRQIKSRLKIWEKGILQKFCQTFPERKREFSVGRSGWPVKPLYTPLDLEEIGFDYLKDSGFPGEYPYTRGLEPNGYRSKFWVMSQISGFGSSEDIAERWRFLLEQGMSGVLIEFDLPTQIGLDSDHPFASGEVGRVGVAIDTLDDMGRALDLPFEKIRQIYAITSSVSIVMLAMFIAALEKKGVSPDFNLTLQNEILKEYACRGMYIFPPQPSVKLAVDVIEYCAKNYPNWSGYSICGVHYAQCRASVVQAAAFSISSALAHIDNALARGLRIDTVAPTMSCLSGFCENFFEHICSIRATRKVWARLMKEKYGAQEARSYQLRTLPSYGGGGVFPIRQQPLNNIARTALALLSNVLAGGNQISTPLYDEGHAIPTEDTVRVGAAIHQIVANELGVADTVDPLAGSYYVEYLTKKIENGILEEIERVEKMGGAIAAVESRYFQRVLEESGYKYQKEIESGERLVVGVNVNRLKGERLEIELFDVDPAAEDRQIKRLNKVKEGRDFNQVSRTLARLKEAAQEKVNMVEPVIEAVKSYATIGEITGVLRDAYGQHEEASFRF